MKRIVALLLAAVMLLTMSVTAFADEKVKDEVWTPLSGSKATTFDTLVEGFNNSQSDVEIVVVHQSSYSILSQKMAAAASAGNLPAVIIADYTNVGLYVQRGLLQPVESILGEGAATDFNAGMMVDLTFDGEAYAVPYNRTTQGFIVNNDLLAQAGINRVASTWDEYYEDAKAFKAAMGDGYYYGFAFFNQFIFDAIASSFGAAFASADGTATANSDEMKEMLSFFRKMYEEDLLVMVPTTSGSFAEQFSPFLEGTVATVFQSSSFVSYAETALDCNWSYELMPAGKAGRACTIGGTNLAVTTAATDAQKPGIKAFLEYITNEDSAATVFMSTANLPARLSVLNREDVQQFMTDKAYFAKNLIGTLEYAVPAPVATKNVGDIYNLVNSLIVRAIYDGEDLDDLLEEYNQLFQDEFDDKIANGEFIY